MGTIRNNISFEIKKHIAVIGQPSGDSWNRELNVVNWNGYEKLDVRGWDKSHEKMTKGITMTDEEGASLMLALMEYFGIKRVCRNAVAEVIDNHNGQLLEAADSLLVTIEETRNAFDILDCEEVSEHEEDL